MTDMGFVWNLLLSVLVGGIGWLINRLWAELEKAKTLISKTREETARDYMTRTQSHADMSRIMDRLDRLDEKLDRLMENKPNGRTAR